jgi:hypothetical protein
MTWLAFTSALQDTVQAVFDPLFGRVVEPVDPEKILSAFEKQKSRDTHDLPPCAKALVVPGIDLDDFDVRIFSGCSFQDGNKSFAGGARRSEKIHENGNLRLHYLLLEIPLVDFDEMP